MFSFCRMNSPYIYCRFQTVFLHQIIILNFKSQLKIYTKRKIASKKQNVEHKCILQESCKTVRRWQRYILLVKGGHCVGDCKKNLRTPGFRVCCFDCGLFYHLGFIYAGSGNGVLKCQMSPIKVLTCAWRNENKTDVEAICIQMTN